MRRAETLLREALTLSDDERAEIAGVLLESLEPAPERAELLARKHERVGFSAEDEARLDALTERVRLLLPRVTQGDWPLVNDIAGRMDEVHDRTQRIRRKYGLSG